MSAPAANRPLPRTDRREEALHQTAAHNRDHWEGAWTDRWGEPLPNHSVRAMREVQEAGLVRLEEGPVRAHFYARLTEEGHALLAQWMRPRGRWANR